MNGDILALQPEAKDAAFALLGLGPTAAESAPAAPLLSLSGFSASGLKNRDPFGPDTNPFLRFTALRANRSSGESVTTSAASVEGEQIFERKRHHIGGKGQRIFWRKLQDGGNEV
ncbi:hypothetical protein T492DRAFT_837050 [Pavlovales sp. CCMP2436]|nr:hypothetical protein T492DRAFT_837050 [Pavlovales sp. CCMP2436]